MKYEQLVKALRCELHYTSCPETNCKYICHDTFCDTYRLMVDAAAAIEELQSILTEADKEQAYQHDYICELVAEKEELQAETERLKAQLPKRGKWIRHPEVKNIYGGEVIECPFCGEKYVVQYIADEKFCRNCGADMRAKMEVQDGQ